MLWNEVVSSEEDTTKKISAQDIVKRGGLIIDMIICLA